MDAHRLFQVDAVVVDETLGLVAAVAPFGDGGAHPCVRRSQQAVKGGADFVRPNFADQFAQPPFAEPGGAELAANVAEHQFGRAAVGGDDALDIVVGRGPR